MTDILLPEDARVVLAYIRDHPGDHPFHISLELVINSVRVTDAIDELEYRNLIEKRLGEVPDERDEDQSHSYP